MWIILSIAGLWWAYGLKPWQTYIDEKTYYVTTDNTPIHACPQDTCERIGHYDSTDYIKSFHSFSELPAWIDLNGGFIRKSDLRE